MADTKKPLPNPSVVQMAKDKILSAPVESIKRAFIESMFASYHDRTTNEFKQAPFDPTWHISLSKNEYKWVEGTIDTTLGRLVFNRHVLEGAGIIETSGYYNVPINSKNLDKLNTIINNFVVTDRLNVKDHLGPYTDYRDRLGFWCASFLSVSISAALVRPMDNVTKRKTELFKQYENVLKNGSAVDQIMVNNKIEKELMDMVRENLKDDYGYDMYASGDGNLNNNYKTINVMRGAVFNKLTNKYDIVESSLMEGIKKKDIPAFSNSVLEAAYPSAVGTAEAGAMSKILLTLLQSEQIDENPKSDCGTKSTVPITITDFNKQYMLFRYINENGKRVLLTLDNLNNYIGKTVNMYSYMGCKQDHVCAKCAGMQYHYLNANSVGLLQTIITQRMLNIKLKSKHDLSQKAGIIPVAYTLLDNLDKITIETNGVLKNKYTMKMFIPRVLEEINGFVHESTMMECMGIFPVKFYDSNDNEIASTMMIVPAVLTFNLYSDIQEDPECYIVTYEPNSEIAIMKIQQTVINVEFFINQIFLNSHTPQLPYNMMLELMFRCLEINHIDLTGPASAYEMLARRLCRKGNDTFAKTYGENMNVDQMSYEKEAYRSAVQHAGVLQGMLFQDLSKSLSIGLAAELNGIEPVDSPLEKIIKA